MKSKVLPVVMVVSVVCLIVFGGSTESQAFKKRLVFGGGPAGGTFQVVANAIQVYKPVKDLKNVKVQAQSSAGVRGKSPQGKCR